MDKELRRVKQKTEYDAHKAAGRCPKCHGKRIAAPKRILCWKCINREKARQAAIHKTNPGKLQAAVRRCIRKVRLEVMAHYGGKCACCGETYDPFLCIDHVNGGGNAHRRQNKILSGFQTYFWLRKNGYPKEFRVLCWNCNAARAYFGKVCDPKHLGCSA